MDPSQQIDLQPDPAGVRLTIKVVPGASRSKVQGVWQNALRIAIAAPPEDGKANAEIAEFLSKMFGLKRRDVCIERGLTNPVKTILLNHIDVQTARMCLAEQLKTRPETPNSKA